MKTALGNFELKSVKDTEKHAGLMATQIKPGTVIILQGDLGVGKTQWTRFFIQHYLKDKKIIVNSPSYSLAQTYNKGAKSVVHMDLYRISNLNDLESTGFWDFVDGKNIVCVEWGTMIPKEQLQAHPLFKIEMKFLDTEARLLTCLSQS